MKMRVQVIYCTNITDKQQQMLKELRVEKRKEVRVRVFEGDDDLDEGEMPATPPPGTGH